MHLCLRESQNWNITLLSQIKDATIPARLHKNQEALRWSKDTHKAKS